MPLFKFNFSNKSVDYCSLRLSVQPLFEFLTEEGPELIYVEYSISVPEFYFEVESSVADVEFSITAPVFFFDILAEEADEARLYLQIKKPLFLFDISPVQFIDIDFSFPAIEPFFHAYRQEDLSIAFKIFPIKFALEATYSDVNILDIQLPRLTINFELCNESVSVHTEFEIPLILFYISGSTGLSVDSDDVIRFEYFYWSFVNKKSIEGIISSDDIISFYQ